MGRLSVEVLRQPDRRFTAGVLANNRATRCSPYFTMPGSLLSPRLGVAIIELTMTIAPDLGGAAAVQTGTSQIDRAPSSPA
jgi:hypothetical protein